jgi:hypothetical protein
MEVLAIMDNLKNEPNLTLERLKQILGAEDNVGIVTTNLAMKVMSYEYKTQKEALATMKILYNALELAYPNRLTLKTRLAKIRTVIKQYQKERVYKYSLSSEYFNLPYTENMIQKQNYKNKVLERNRTPDDIPDNIIEIATEWLNSNDKYQKALAVLLAIGSRPIELFKTGVYEVEDENHIIVSGLAKKRENNNKLSTIRPVLLISATEAVAAVETVRNEFKSNSILDRDGNLSSYIVRMLTKRCLDLGTTTYNLRRIYARLAYEQFGNNTNFNVFIGDILGHENVTTSFSYSNISPSVLEEEKKAVVDTTDYKAKFPDKWRKMERIYENRPLIGAAQLRKETKASTAMAYAFLKTKR